MKPGFRPPEPRGPRRRSPGTKRAPPEKRASVVGRALTRIGLDPKTQAAKRRQAVALLGRLRSREAVSALRLALVDRDLEVRKLAARALGEIGDLRALQDLVVRADDSALDVVDKGVRLAADAARKKLTRIWTELHNDGGRLAKAEKAYIDAGLSTRFNLPEVVELIRSGGFTAEEQHRLVAGLKAHGLGDDAIRTAIEAVGEAVRYHRK